MCSNEPLPVAPEAYEKMPLAIDSDHPIFNFGKKELTAALRTARDHDWAADWLFRHSAHPFHPDARPLPPEAFGRSLAVHVHHDISTPGACPSTETSLLPLRHNASSTHDSRLLVTKDIDLLLVPIARVADVTAGYAFVRGVSESAFHFSGTASFSQASGAPEQPAPPSNPTFVIARFVFNHPRNDFLMALSGQSSPMTGLVSMRWISAETRERSYFAVPNADYGAGNLPSRVLSVQCNVDHQINTTPNPLASDPVPTPSPSNDPAQQPLATPLQTQAPSPLPDPVQRDDVLPQANESSSISPEPSISSDVAPNPAPGAEPWFSLDDPIPSTSQDGLASIGTVLHPEDPDALLPTFMQDFMSSSMDLELERILSDDVVAADEPHAIRLPGGSMDSIFSEPSERSSDTVPSESPSGSGNVASSNDEDARSDKTKNISSGAAAQWLVSSRTSTPDGVGATRQPGASDTSSGAFDLSMLADSLNTIESSLKGEFFGPRVRKDVMHPQTGELMSRCMGQLSGFVRKIDNGVVQVLREIAAQSYYSSRLPVAPDNRMLVAAPPPVPTAPRQPRHDETQLNGHSSAVAQPNPGSAIPVKPPVGFKPVRPQPRLAPLAPRQMPLATVRLAAAPLATAPLPVVGASDSAMEVESTGRKTRELSREERLEAKRIKNRMSAAKSNQKRRLQLEKRKAELDTLRKRVEELQDKQKSVAEENERLKAKVALGS